MEARLNDVFGMVYIKVKWENVGTESFPDSWVPYSSARAGRLVRELANSLPETHYLKVNNFFKFDTLAIEDEQAVDTSNAFTEELYTAQRQQTASLQILAVNVE